MTDTTQQQQLAIKELQDLAPTAAAFLETVRGMEAIDEQTCAQMADVRKSISNAEKKLAAKKKTVTGPLQAAVKAINALFKPSEDALDSALKLTKGKLDRYAHQQLVVESARRAEERRQAEARETEARESAMKLREQGATETANEIEKQARADVVTASKPAHVEAVRGESAQMSTRAKWHGRVISIREFCAAVAAGSVPETCIAINLKALNEHAAQRGEALLAKDPEALEHLYLQEGFAIAFVGESATR